MTNPSSLDEAEAAFLSVTETEPRKPEAWRGLAQAARQRGDRARSLECWRRAFELEPGHGGVAAEIAADLQALGRFDEAEAVSRKLTETQPRHPRGWHGLAQAARRRGDRARSLECWRKAFELGPGDARLAVEMANDLRELGRLDEAEAVSRNLAQAQPQKPHGWRGLAQVARQRGDRARSLECWRRAFELEPGDAWLAVELASDLRELGRLDEAEAVSRKLAETQPQKPHGWRGLAQVARQRGDRARSLECWRKAFELDSGNGGVAVEMANDLRELGRLDEAEAVCAKLAETQPHSPHSWRGLAQVARQRGDRARSLECWRMAFELEPGNGGVAVEMANDLRELGHLDEAEAVCAKLAETQPHSPHGWRGLAQVARQRGDRARSLECWRMAFELEPSDARLAVEMSNDLRELGRLDEAESVCAKLAETQPHSPHGWRGLAYVARQRGDRARSLECWRKTFELEPGNGGAAAEMANDLRELGRLDEAEAVTFAAKVAHPHSAQAAINYANFIRRKISKTELINLLEQAARLEPDNPGPAMALAAEYMAFWRLDDAEALYDRALAKNENFLPALTGKGHLFRRKGDRTRAMNFFSRALELNADIEGHAVEYARELIGAGSVDQGLGLLRNAVYKRKNWGHCHLLIGLTAREKGDHDLAKLSFEAACHAGFTTGHAWTELAVEDFRLGNTNAAIDRIRQVLRERPTFVRALELLAELLQSQDDLEGALDMLSRAREIDGSQPHSLIAIARLQAQLGRFEEADASFVTCAAQFGALPEAETTKAFILRQRGSYQAAREALEKAASMFPSHFGAWSSLLNEYVACGEFVRARELFETNPAAIEHEHGRAFLFRAQLALAQWRLEEAAELLELALSKLPANPHVNSTVARCALLRVELETVRLRLERVAEFDLHHRMSHGGGRKPSQTHEGQLLDEYRIDVSALSRLRKAAASPDPVPGLTELVIDAPQYTPAAIGLMVALRRKGLLERDSGASRPQSLIPRKIAQFWDKDVPPDVQDLCKSWQEIHPDYSYELFSNESAARFLLDRRARGVHAAFARATEPAMKADIFRLARLYFDGGYYLDADDRCLARLEELDPGGCELLLYQEDLGTVGNNFIGVAPRHPVIGLALQGAVEALNRGDSDVVWLATGPGLLTRAVARYLADDLPNRLNRVRVLERHELAKSVAIHCMTSYKYTRKHWSRTSFQKHRKLRLSVQDLLATGKGGDETSSSAKASPRASFDFQVATA